MAALPRRPALARQARAGAPLTALAVVLAVLLALPTGPAAAQSDQGDQGPLAPADAGPVPAADVPDIGTPGRTARIRFVRSVERDGWRYDQYRNPDYPCAISGDSTFVVATRLGTPADAVRPLWVYLHGGGFGYFDAAGAPQPDGYRMTEESLARQLAFVTGGDSNGGGGLLSRARSAPAGFRMLAVSMCHHDGYLGGGQADPNNPAAGRPVDGLLAATAAISYALQTLPTDDYVLHGTSSGSFGVWATAWSLSARGLAPTALIADSGVLGDTYEGWIDGEPGCGDPNSIGYRTFRRRVHPALLADGNEPAALVADGRIASPVLDVWVPRDPVWCGDRPVQCPVDDGIVILGATRCMHEGVRRAIAAQGPLGRSLSMELCVDDPNVVGDCDLHVPTVFSGRANTAPLWPADYLTPIMQWVDARLADDGTTPPSPRSPRGSFAAAAVQDFLGAADVRREDAVTVALTAGRAKATVLARLTTSRPWLEAIVQDLYRTTLGRSADAAGLAYWVEVLASGRRTVAQVAAGFYASPEYAGSNPAAWVTSMYRAILGRAPEPGATTYWADAAARRGRTWVALSLYQSAESAGARVTDLYHRLLGRAPSTSDVRYWAPQVVSRGDLTLAVVLANSAEYQLRAERRFP